MKISFNIPFLTGNEGKYMLDALRSRKHCGNHQFGKLCIELMKKNIIWVKILFVMIKLRLIILGIM